MIPLPPHFYRWLRALPLLLALFASAASAVSAVSADAQASVIISECEVVAVLGQSFHYEIQADNQALGYSVTNLPHSIKCEENRLSGTAMELGQYF